MWLWESFILLAIDIFLLILMHDLLIEVHNSWAISSIHTKLRKLAIFTWVCAQFFKQFLYLFIFYWTVSSGIWSAGNGNFLEFWSVFFYCMCWQVCKNEGKAREILDKAVEHGELSKPLIEVLFFLYLKHLNFSLISVVFMWLNVYLFASMIHPGLDTFWGNSVYGKENWLFRFISWKGHSAQHRECNGCECFNEGGVIKHFLGGTSKVFMSAGENLLTVGRRNY